MKYNNVQELINYSVRIYDGMTIVWPQYDKEEPLYFACNSATFNGCYAVNNGTLGFGVGCDLYVTPYTRRAIRILHEEAFTRKEFYVPFSNWDYPKAEAEKWQFLKEEARQSYKEDFAEDCAKYCDEHGIGTLSKEILENCFVMPDNGVRVRHIGYEDMYYPVIQNYCLDSVAIGKLGKFCTNNGKVVFIYRDGKTYVTRGYRMLETLRKAGYKETGIFVPFSNGEQIQDPALKARWEAIKK